MINFTIILQKSRWKVIYESSLRSFTNTEVAGVSVRKQELAKDNFKQWDTTITSKLATYYPELGTSKLKSQAAEKQVSVFNELGYDCTAIMVMYAY